MTSVQKRFAVVDVETANSDVGSICQIGIAIFADEQLVESWGTLVNPKCDFSGMNISIHGITPDQVADAPTIFDVQAEIEAKLANAIRASHGAFDRLALSEALSDKTYLTGWLDVTRVVRRAWPEFASSGYALKKICRALGINQGRHHDAVEDAIASGRVLCHAIAHSGISLDQWSERVTRPIDLTWERGFARDGNREGHLFGETVVFTGELSLTRKQAAELAAYAGCAVADGVTKKTTLLVVGTQDLQKTKQTGISAKQVKADALIKKGQDIIVLSENDFLKIVQIPEPTQN